MKKIGLLIELKNGALKPANLGMITAAVKKDHELFAILMESAMPEVHQQLAQYGANHIVTVRMNPPGWNPPRWSQAVVTVMTSLNLHTLMGMTSAQGKDLLPRVAAIMDAPLVMDCVQVDIEQQMAKTSQYSGKTMATFHLTGNTILYGMRPNTIVPVVHPTVPQITEQVIDIPEDTQLDVIKTVPGEQEYLNLSEAEVIVSGGRGMKNGENFNLLFDCAKSIEGAAVGASRVAVDEGWVPYAMQVGQTGTKVNPKVYIACGISGSVQHLAGMKTSGLIIAINTDADAAILTHCDYYVIGDLFTILPALTRKLNEP
ncbi:MAG: electron transfer flavoprotein subunit alpha/FixB family protein [Deltaproteobacteria bacterium]|nr:electron transfer flavoprotein subunit alpha/FixB family protein [Deltaproteobacteria bacterium]